MDMNYVIEITKELLDIPSPVGYTHKAMKRVASELETLNIKYSYTKKGAILGVVEGNDNSYSKMVSAHIDTIGAMVKKIKSNGRLEVVNLGGINWAGVEGENLTIHTITGEIYEGTLMPTKSSVHIYGDEARDIPRNQTNMEVRLDEDVTNAEDVRKLGIEVGDFISFDPRTKVTTKGYFKSRYIDDKACVGLLLGYLKYLKDNGLKPQNKLYIYISNYEEIGHGVSVFPEDLDEFIALDIGLVGEEAQGDERKVSIALKDNKTPYSIEIKEKMIKLSKEKNIGYTLDVYNRYGSDASAAIMQGFDFKIACIGPSVESSHHYERTHLQGIKETINLLIAYL